MNKKKKSTNISPYPDDVIDRLARAFYPAILACWNSEEGQREFAAWQAEQAHISGKEKQEVPAGELPALLIVCGFLQGASGWAHPVFVCAYFFRIRIAFRTAMIVTPTSPNTASHIPAMPSAPRTRNTLLMPRAITMFCITIRFVAFATSMASTSFDGSSVIRTTSAASIAASEPRPPMAMPTSARARTGASLMPSPTKASLLPCRFCLSSISSFSTFWSGKSCA